MGISTRSGGFTLQLLASAVGERSSWSATQYSTRSVAYALAKLRGQSLVHAVEHSRRIPRNPAGGRAMCAYLVLRDKVIKPLLADVARPIGRPPKNIAPLDRHYLTPSDELHGIFAIIGLAA